MSSLYERTEYEGEEGRTLGPSRLENLLKSSQAAGEETCPKCNRRQKLFFGDADGEYWCVLCQITDDLGLAPAGATVEGQS